MAAAVAANFPNPHQQHHAAVVGVQGIVLAAPVPAPAHLAIAGNINFDNSVQQSSSSISSSYSARSALRRQKTFQAYLPTGSRTYRYHLYYLCFSRQQLYACRSNLLVFSCSCAHCRANLANHTELISKSFQGSQGKAYLFNAVYVSFFRILFTTRTTAY